MLEDALGFEYPVIDESLCINCGKCDKVCPFLNRDSLVNAYSVKWLGLRHLDNNVLELSSSGGAFTAIIQAYENIIGARPVVYGAAWDMNFKVRHKRVSQQDDLDLIRRSKYIQSELLNVLSTLQKDLDAGLPVVFSGTPCQVASIISLFGDDRKENLLTIEVICKGVASPVVLASWIDWLQKGKRTVASIIFRSRKKAEEASVVRVKFDRGKDYTRICNTYDDPFMDAFFKGFTSRDCCSVCPFSGMRRSADFTIGDYWGAANDPNMLFDRENGTSVVVCNNERAEKIAEKLSDIATTFVADKEIVVAGNSSLTQYPGESIDREKYLTCFREEGFDSARKKFATPRPWYRRLASLVFSDFFKRKVKTFLARS